MSEYSKQQVAASKTCTLTIPPFLWIKNRTMFQISACTLFPNLFAFIIIYLFYQKRFGTFEKLAPGLVTFSFLQQIAWHKNLCLLRCKNLWHFFFVFLARAGVWVLFNGLLAPFFLFYVIREFDKFLHRGWAKNVMCVFGREPAWR